MILLKRLPLIVTLGLLIHGFTFVAYAQEKIVVVTNRNNDVQAMDKKGLIDLFMGKYSAFPNGKEATPIDVELEGELQRQFNQSLVWHPLARVKANCKRLNF